MTLLQPALNAGFVDTPVGTHISRTIMLADLRRLLDACSADADLAAYRVAVVQENVLLKPTVTTRKESFARLRQLYALDRAVPLFAALRSLWQDDPLAQPMLAMLCALGRDPLLRSTADSLLNTPVGTAVTSELFESIVTNVFSGRYSQASLASLGRNIASSWQQSGHLHGKLHKVRAQAVARPGAVVYALLLGYLNGGRGEGLFHTIWTRVLEAPLHVLDTQAQTAAQRGWIEYRRVGDVVEVEFRHLLQSFS